MKKSQNKPAAGDPSGPPDAIKEMVQREVAPIQTALEEIHRQVAVLAATQQRLLTILEGLDRPGKTARLSKPKDFSGPGETGLPQPQKPVYRETEENHGPGTEHSPGALKSKRDDPFEKGDSGRLKGPGSAGVETRNRNDQEPYAEEELSLDMAWAGSTVFARQDNAPQKKRRPAKGPGKRSRAPASSPLSAGKASAPPSPPKGNPADTILPGSGRDIPKATGLGPSPTHAGGAGPGPTSSATAGNAPPGAEPALDARRTIEEKKGPAQNRPVIFSPVDTPSPPENAKRITGRLIGVPLALVLVLALLWQMDNLFDRRAIPTTRPAPVQKPDPKATATAVVPAPVASPPPVSLPADVPSILWRAEPATGHLPPGPAPLPADGGKPSRPAVPATEKRSAAVALPPPSGSLGPKAGPGKPPGTGLDRTATDFAPRRPYAILLATLRRPEQVAKAVAAYRRMGLSPYWAKVDLGKTGIWYRMFHGYFETDRAAEKVRTALGLETALVKKTRWTARIGRYEARDAEAVRRRLDGARSWLPHTVFGPDGLEAFDVGAFYTREGAAAQCEALRTEGFGCMVVER